MKTDEVIQLWNWSDWVKVWDLSNFNILNLDEFWTWVEITITSWAPICVLGSLIVLWIVCWKVKMLFKCEMGQKVDGKSFRKKFKVPKVSNGDQDTLAYRSKVSCCIGSGNDESYRKVFYSNWKVQILYDYLSKQGRLYTNLTFCIESGNRNSYRIAAL